MENKKPLINGRHYPLWQQFVDRKSEWIGGILIDSGDPIDRILCGPDENTTKITDIILRENGKESAFFLVEGEAFSCGFDVGVGGIGNQHEKHSDSIQFHGYGGHTWRIAKPELLTTQNH